MNKICFSLATAAMLTGMSLAQTSANAQAGASASQNTSAQANRSGAQANSQESGQASAQSALSHSGKNSSASAASSNQLASGTAIPATLDKPVDARKAKPGDQVVAKTTQNVKSNGTVVVPKGSKLIGHVTQVQARGKGQSESAVGVVFDRAVLKDGRTIPMSASIQAISASEASAAAALEDEPMVAAGSASGMASGGAAATGGLAGGAGHALGTTSGALVNTAGSVGGAAGSVRGATAASSTLNSSSHGVIGMSGLSLDSATANQTQASVIRSTSRNVHLDSGTQMILQVTGR
jgi:hypothetical protein